ncbi:hypothetical protein HBH98_032510 [Parastagonospora nodorum]|nr:hypothetical protein HBH98_032510 [Parastagonospora nodorum]KAH4396131.1 hypothetical protein HBH97_017100 [Parastagonospora nodorum]KAH4427053.1 hypothetical protein HBH99_021420 [Parastagonospora nodorum]KAH4908049.1 hypothetical protein HBI80_058480 [Parastagonospora nodorum]KAH5119597.1 hypothetical protein HBH71_080310 [Parastagonospora nodorum]
MLAGNASHPEEERRWVYAIHKPTKLQNVYPVLVNERPLLELGAIHEGFFDLEQAWYFVVHRYIRDSGPPLCVQIERWIRIRKECTEVVEFEKIDYSASAEPGEGFGQCYAVAKKQAESFSSNEYQKFRNRASAVRYLRSSGLPNNQIRLFRKTFTSQPNFTPNPKAKFKKEFKRLDDDDGYMDLDDDQTLEIDLAMYRKAGKTTRDRPDQNIYDRIDLCLITLKDNPYVNILDLVDTYRTGRPICTFDNWNEFKRYTLRVRRMDMEVANQNEFLAPLLQDFRRGPMAVDSRRIRR